MVQKRSVFACFMRAKGFIYTMIDVENKLKGKDNHSNKDVKRTITNHTTAIEMTE